CGNCSKTSTSLKRCSKCQTERYCNRDCQKAHWKTHKKVCASLANAAAGAGSSTSSSSTSASSNPAEPASFPDNVLDVPVPNPFTRLDNGTWLHGRSERDTYRLLIDTYRIRTMDEYKLLGKVSSDSVLSKQVSSSIDGFKKFMDKVEREHRHLLPKWWSDEKRRECEKRGLDDNAWESLRRAPEKADFVSHYGQPRMPMQLRMFAEFMCGQWSGQDGKGMRELMMKIEDG
ncbi:hypothetical protein BC567DRAFT_150537, partial [Phyllosticta citribraziliensis]